MATIQLKARHFRSATFFSNNPIVIALNENGFDGVDERVNKVTIDHKTYAMDYYGINDFRKDLLRAGECGYDETVIREINIEGL